MAAIRRLWTVGCCLLLASSAVDTGDSLGLASAAAVRSDDSVVAAASTDRRLASAWTAAADAVGDPNTWRGYRDPTLLALAQLREDPLLTVQQRGSLDAGLRLLLARAEAHERHGPPPPSDPTIAGALEERWADALEAQEELSRCRNTAVDVVLVVADGDTETLGNENAERDNCDVAEASATVRGHVSTLLRAADTDSLPLSAAHRSQLRLAAAALEREASELTAAATKVQPLSFSLPRSVWARLAPLRHAGGVPGFKLVDFAPLLPGVRRTTHADAYNQEAQTGSGSSDGMDGKKGDEAAYFAAYGGARFAVTAKKSGWDCLRHYEILASGTVPYVLDLESLPLGTMATWPRHLLKAATELPGMPSEGAVRACVAAAKKATKEDGGGCQGLGLDRSEFDERAYLSLRADLMAWTEAHLLSGEVSKAVNPTGAAAVIVHSCGDDNKNDDGNTNERFANDFMRDSLVVGLVEGGANVYVTFDATYLVDGAWPIEKMRDRLFGKGFTLGGAIPISDASRLVTIAPGDISAVATRLAAEAASVLPPSAGADIEVDSLSVKESRFKPSRKSRCGALYVATTKSNGPLPLSANEHLALFNGLFGAGCGACVDGNDIDTFHRSLPCGHGAALFRREALPMRITDF